MKRAKVGDVVEVSWVDSTRLSLGWDERQAYLEAVVDGGERTSGYLLRSDKRRVIVATSCAPALGHWCDAMSIPRLAIRSIVVLGRARRRTRRALKRPT